MNLQEYPDRDMMMIAVANRIAGDLGDALRSTGRASLCVPGGTTPGPVFDMLSAVDLDWANVSVFLNDERWVAEDDARSNTRLLRQRLFQGKAAAATLVPLHIDVPTPEEAVETLAQGIAPHLPISVLLLGMGEDGHTASLFPGGDRLEEALADNAPILMPMRAGGAGEPRITLTLPVLQGAMRIHLLITGAEKRAVLETAEAGLLRDAPVKGILGEATVHWSE